MRSGPGMLAVLLIVGIVVAFLLPDQKPGQQVLISNPTVAIPTVTIPTVIPTLVEAPQIGPNWAPMDIPKANDQVQPVEEPEGGNSSQPTISLSGGWKWLVIAIVGGFVVFVAILAIWGH